MNNAPVTYGPWHRYPTIKPPREGRYLVFRTDGFAYVDRWEPKLELNRFGWRAFDSDVIAFCHLPMGPSFWKEYAGSQTSKDSF